MHKRSTQGIALVPGTNNDISGLGTISCSSLTVGGSAVIPPPDYVVGITPGSAAANKALVLNGTFDISGINALSATLITGTLSTAAQGNITSLGTLTGLSIGGSLTISGTSRVLSITGSGSYINATAYRQGGTAYDISAVSKLSLTTDGIAEASKALVLDSSLNMRGIVAFEVNHSSTSITSSSMMSSYALLLRSKSTAVGASTGICFAATTNAIGSSTGGASILFSASGANSVGALTINVKPTSGGVSTALSEAVRITSDGLVGINQLYPSEMLDVGGNAYIAGNLSIAGGALFSNGGATQVMDSAGNMTPPTLTTPSLTVAAIL
ncbi:unnamed protein product [Phytophthora lilii]|uniref:Unnamed protein product n=1 Tax=Phytophthora lilii TaxID=2077276 RepID=A0A9W6YFT5_9STRA|nr:unnamed protein product [Phytophthora lilii]